jgi:hypothetical protein
MIHSFLFREISLYFPFLHCFFHASYIVCMYTQRDNFAIDPDHRAPELCHPSSLYDLSSPNKLETTRRPLGCIPLRRTYFVSCLRSMTDEQVEATLPGGSTLRAGLATNMNEKKIEYKYWEGQSSAERFGDCDIPVSQPIWPHT